MKITFPAYRGRALAVLLFAAIGCSKPLDPDLKRAAEANSVARCACLSVPAQQANECLIAADREHPRPSDVHDDRLDAIYEGGDKCRRMIDDARGRCALSPQNCALCAGPRRGSGGIDAVR